MKLKILGTNLDTTSYTLATEKILDWAREGKSRYICIANVHVLMDANDFCGFQKIINNANLVTPDGMPLVWMMRMKGASNQQRVYGPTLMLHVLEIAARMKIPVGFYGGGNEMLNLLVGRMQARYEGLIVSFAYSPPFTKMDPKEDKATVARINQSDARILFVGLGCPKQEIWMAEHQGRVNAVMLGVGAAFDFHAGVKSQAPAWMQMTGLEWLFRLLTEPRRLWKRYIYHNPRFMVLAAADLLGLLKIKGLHHAQALFG